jgi:ABC-type antimicrobial peptide transport system permease subunit
MLLLQILPDTEEEIPLMTTCSLQYSNKVAINKLSPFSLNLTFAVEHNLKRQYSRWLAKHLLCQTHTLNKATTMAMEMASIIKVPVSEALRLDRAMVAMMTLLSKMAFNHQHKAHQQLQGLAPDFLVVYPVVLNQGLLVYLMAQLQTEECRGNLLPMLAAFLNTHHLSVQA